MKHESHSVTRRWLLRQLLVGAGAIGLGPEVLSCASAHPPGGVPPGGVPPTRGAAPIAHPAIPTRPVVEAAASFLKALGPEQRSLALFPFEDDRRRDWHFVPKSREGIPYKRLDANQAGLADALLEAGLGLRGARKIAEIRRLEPILHELEQGRGPTRDPDLYYVAIFGEPGDSKPWGWSVEGHHVSLNFTLVGADRLASTPTFLGANPAEVRHGPRAGLRVLAAEEDTARRLVASLDGERRARAVVSATAPSEILSWNSRKAVPIQPAGLHARAMSEEQTQILLSLIEEYAGTMAPAVAAARMSRIRAAGVGDVAFAWAGALERGRPHYYRVQGPTFLIEYDNTQNDANHVHSVWRDFTGDFGEDLLAAHYDESHR